MPRKSQASRVDLDIAFETEILAKDELMRLNRQAGLLMAYLLDFRNTLTMEDNDHLEAPYLPSDPKLIRAPTVQEQRNQHAKDEYRKSFDIANCEAKVDLAYAICKSANAIRSEQENRWTNVIVHQVFGSIHNSALALERPDPHRSIEDAIGKIRNDCDRLWTKGTEILEDIGKQPKPDMCLSFHAYNQNREDGGPMCADPYIANFGKDSLSNLYKQNKLAVFKPYSSPFERFYKPDQQYCDQSCFPWAICEWKKPGANPRELDKQVARAGAIAVTILANITAGWYGRPILDSIRPVVCFSFLGEQVEVYLVFIVHVSPEGWYKYQVRRIWKGNLTDVVHNIELCWIIERLHRWAIHHLRPWLSSCIDAWHMHDCPGQDCKLHPLSIGVLQDGNSAQEVGSVSAVQEGDKNSADREFQPQKPKRRDTATSIVLSKFTEKVSIFRKPKKA